MPTASPPTAPPTPPSPALPTQPENDEVKYQQYIDTQIERTQQAVKLVDLGQQLMLLIIGLLAFLLTAAVIEHWILPGGFSFGGRLLLFVLLFGGVGTFVVRHLWPLLSRPINPTFAAQAIERENPTLKNSLINILLFRSHQAEMSSAVYETIEQQAAQRLSRSSVDGAIDRGPLIRLGYLLLALTAIAMVYTVASPKSSLSTAARVLMPWASITPPSRVRIEQVKPGDVEVVQGDSLTLTARVIDLHPGEEVRLQFLRADEAVGRGRWLKSESVVMLPVDDNGKYSCQLPPVPKGSASSAGTFSTTTFSSAGMQHDLRYRIVAGDGQSLDYAIRVLTAPAIHVRQIHYDFPDYTGYRDQQVENRGDIRAIEGTKVTLIAEANHPIESAHLDLASDGRPDHRMRVDGHQARVTLPLTIEGDRRSIRSTTYQLHFTNLDGHTNKRPTQHALEVTPDYPPELELTEPIEPVREVQLNETITLSVEARDPDFALAQVWIRMEKKEGGKVTHHQLLSKRHRGRFHSSWKFTPMDYDLAAGDIVEYWAEAVDVRAPQANRSTSTRRQLHIVGNPSNGAASEGGEENQGTGSSEQANSLQEGGQGDSSNQNSDSGEATSEAGNNDQENEGNQGGEQGTEGSQESKSSEQGSSEQEGSSQAGEPQEGGQGSSENQGSAGSESTEEGSNSGEAASATGNSSSDSSDQQGSENQSSESQAGENQNSDNQNSGNQGEGKSGEGDQSPVANDGTDDATAFDRIQRQLTEQERGNATRRDANSSDSPSNNPPQQGSPSEQTNGEKPAGAKPSVGQPSVGQTSEGQTSEGQTQGDKPEDGQPEGANSQAPNPNESTSNDASASTSGDARTNPGNEGPKNEGSPQGSPDQQQDPQQRNKRPDDGTSGSESDTTEPPTPGQDKKESDSRGEQGGDKSGGGEEGNGQKSPREGTGSAGQNQAADQGGGKSADQGPGEQGAGAGNDQQANQPTGNPGEQPGNGSEKRPSGSEQGNSEQGSSEQGNSEQPGQPGKAGQGSEAGDPSNQNSSQQEQPNNNADNADNSSSSQGGADGTASNNSPGSSDGPLAEADEANLDYARKKTDLVLNKLEDQLNKNEVDQKMLDKLGWSKKDLRKFVDRWNKLRADAARPDAEAAQQELDARLKNLGQSLRPTTGRTNRQQDDFRDLREGYHGKVPLKYRDRLKAYTEGVSKPRP